MGPRSLAPRPGAKTKCSGEDEREAGDGAACLSRQGNGGDERATRDGMAWQRQVGFGGQRLDEEVGGDCGYL